MNILAIGAHFDDVELGCGGTLARHVRMGDQVFIYVATLSGFANPESLVVRDSSEALEEGRSAAKILGAELICGKFETLKLEFTDELNTELVHLVEENNIELIYTHWIGDIHHDHVALARASLHSGRHVPRMLMYCSNWYQSYNNFHSNFYVDISAYWEMKERAILAYQSEYKRVGRKWIDYFKRVALNNGNRVSVDMAEAFEVVKWLCK